MQTIEPRFMHKWPLRLHVHGCACVISPISVVVNCTSGDCHVSACNFQYSLLSFNPSKILELASMIVMCVLFRDFFGLSSDFPVSRLMTKAGDESRLFYVSPALKQLIDCNQTVVNVSIIQLLDQSLSSDTLGIASWK